MGTPKNLAVRQLTSGMDKCARSNETKSLLPGRFSAAAQETEIGRDLPHAKTTVIHSLLPGLLHRVQRPC